MRALLLRAFALYGLLGISYILFVVVKRVFYSPSAASSVSGMKLFLALMFSIVIFIAVLARTRTGELHHSPRALCRGLSVLLLVYFGSQYPFLPSGENFVAGSIWAFNLIYVVGLAGALLAWRSPYFLLVTPYALWWTRRYAEHATGLNFTAGLDIIVLIEFVTLFVACIAVFETARRLLPVIQSRSPNLRTIFNQIILHPESVVLIPVTIVIANYVFSALAKITLDGGPLSWILQNQNADIFAVALVNRQLLWGASSFVPLIDAALQMFSIPFALLIVALQLGAIFTLANKRIAAIVFLALDGSHLAIFILVGANFLSWFMLNLAIVFALSRTDKRALSLTTMGLLLPIIGANPFFFTIARLGWYDTLAVNSTYFVAVDGNGVQTRVPSTFFGLYSYPIAHMSFGHPPGSYVGTLTNGGTYSWQIHAAASQCSESLMGESPFAKRWNPTGVKNLVRGYHMRAKEAAQSPFAPHRVWFMHHFWSELDIEREFDRLNLSDVVEYKLIVESFCLTDKSNRRAVKRVGRNEFVIDL